MIGIVGGGIAGLSAAHRLQAAGHEVQVFEAADQVGGLAATYGTEGDRIEAFYHHLSKSERTIVELAEELGLGDRVEWRVGRNAYYVDGVVHPLDTPWEIAAYPHLSLYDKFRLGMLTMEVDVRNGIPAFDTYDSLADFEDVPIREFLVEHTTQGVYDYFFEPLLDAKFGSRKEDVSAAWLLGRIKFRGERDLLRGELLGYFDGGFHRLIDALQDASEVIERVYPGPIPLRNPVPEISEDAAPADVPELNGWSFYGQSDGLELWTWANTDRDPRLQEVLELSRIHAGDATNDWRVRLAGTGQRKRQTLAEALRVVALEMAQCPAPTGWQAGHPVPD